MDTPNTTFKPRPTQVFGSVFTLLAWGVLGGLGLNSFRALPAGTFVVGAMVIAFAVGVLNVVRTASSRASA